MKAKTRNTLITAAAIVIVVLGVAKCTGGAYNNMVSLDEQVSAQWAQVENQYQRRYDLIPNLVSTVKGYAQHESSVLTQVSEARARAGGAVSIGGDIVSDPEKFAEFQEAQDALGSSLRRLLMVTENYPDLKADRNFLALQDELEGTENRIAVERKRYNEAAQGFNTTIRRFPNNILAGLFGDFSKKAYFAAASEAQTAPKVEF